MSTLLSPPPYWLYRRIRRDPTISLVREIIKAAVVSAGWGVEKSDDASDEQATFIESQLDDFRDAFVEQAILSGIDFGWQAWHLIFDTDGREMHIDRIRPLIHDLCQVYVDDYGDLEKIRQTDRSTGRTVDYYPEDLVFLSWRVEGDQILGEPLLVNVREAYNQWIDINSAAERYDKRIAGGALIVGYRAGTSVDAHGNERDNAELALELGQELESAGIITVEQAREIEQGIRSEVPDWDFKILENPNAHPQFNERLEYSDKLKVRGMGFPERALLEATLAGSRADSLTAARFAVKNLELAHVHIANAINRQIITPLSIMNWGPGSEKRVKYIPGPIDVPHLETLQEVAQNLIKDQDRARAMVDIENLYDQVGIPVSNQEN